ncbi:MAG: four helix bundle protein [Armatimonadetes bacterium]|nr:four helix bundle protein [Armatimonadota bacterium]
MNHDLAERTKGFALCVVRVVAASPKTMEAQVLGKQLLRSATSVGANYREARRSRSRAEFIAKIGDCLKELDETAYWLELLTESGIIPEPRVASLQEECNQLIAIFTTISKKAKNNLQ